VVVRLRSNWPDWNGKTKESITIKCQSTAAPSKWFPQYGGRVLTCVTYVVTSQTTTKDWQKLITEFTGESPLKKSRLLGAVCACATTLVLSASVFAAPVNVLWYSGDAGGDGTSNWGNSALSNPEALTHLVRPTVI